MLSWHYLYSFGYYISYLVFILDYRLDEARRTYFGSFLEQGGAGKEALPRRDVSTSRRLHVATSPSHDVEVNYFGSQPFTTSRRHRVATLSRRDATTSRRLLKILHLIIKCEEARESRGNERACGQRHEIGDLQTLTGGFFLDSYIGFYLFTWLFLDYMRGFFILCILFLSFMMF